MEELMEKIRMEEQKLREGQRICNHIKKHMQHDSISNELGDKLENIFTTHDLGDDIKLDANTNLLGIADQPEIKLTYNENQAINDLFRLEPLNEEKIASTDVNDKLTLEVRDKLTEAIGLYCGNLTVKHELLREVVDFHKNSVAKICRDKIEEAKVKIEANKYKMKIVDERFRTDVLNEVPIAMNAYKTILKDIKEQQKFTEKEYKELLDLKNKYKLARSKEYEEILKNYLAYMNSIDSKKELFDKLNLKY